MSENQVGVQLLSTNDIYDVYGCQELLRGCRDGSAEQYALSDDDLAEVRSRVYEIHKLYVDSAKARIRAEARMFGGLKGGSTFSDMFEQVAQMRSLLAKNLQAKQMAGPVNLMQEIVKAQMASGMKVDDIDFARIGMTKPVKPVATAPAGVDPEWFKKHGTVFDNPKWYDISRAYIALERAEIADDMIAAIDRLNQLQHNSFHILIDLQNGRMLNGSSHGELYGDDKCARSNLQEVLDICHAKRSPVEFADKMSGVIRGLIRKYLRDVS